MISTRFFGVDFFGIMGASISRGHLQGEISENLGIEPHHVHIYVLLSNSYIYLLDISSYIFNSNTSIYYNSISMPSFIKVSNLRNTCDLLSR